MFVQGRGYAFVAGQTLLIETQGAGPTDPPVRQIVHLVSDGVETSDPLFPQAPVAGGPPFMTVPTSPPEALEPAAVTRLDWEPADALTTARDLAVTTVIGNLAQATQGRTVIESFAIEDPAAAPAALPYAFERLGARALTAPGVCGDAPAIRAYTLANAPLTWFAQPALDPSGLPVADILIAQASPAGGPPIPWDWVRSLLSAGPFDQSFTVEPALVSSRSLAIPIRARRSTTTATPATRCASATACLAPTRTPARSSPAPTGSGRARSATSRRARFRRSTRRRRAPPTSSR